MTNARFYRHKQSQCTNACAVYTTNGPYCTLLFCIIQTTKTYNGGRVIDIIIICSEENICAMWLRFKRKIDRPSLQIFTPDLNCPSPEVSNYIKLYQNIRRKIRHDDGWDYINLTCTHWPLYTVTSILYYYKLL